MYQFIPYSIMLTISHSRLVVSPAGNYYVLCATVMYLGRARILFLQIDPN